MDGRTRFDRIEAELYAELGLQRQVTTVDLQAPDPLAVRVVRSGTGSPVLFVHGGGGFGATFAPLLGQIPGVAAIVPDRPGFGLSDGLDHRGLDLRHHAVAVLTGVLDASGIDRVSVVGTSMGGLWALWLALDRPDRVDRIVQLGCPALVVGTGAPLAMRLMGKRSLGHRMLRAGPSGREGFAKTLARLGEPSDAISRTSERLLELGGVAMALPTFEVAWLSLLGNSLRLRGANPRWAMGEEELRGVHQPILAAWGGRDPFGGLDAARRFGATTNAKLIELPNAGHLPWLDEPSVIGRAIADFLGTTASADVGGDVPWHPAIAPDSVDRESTAVARG